MLKAVKILGWLFILGALSFLYELMTKLGSVNQGVLLFDIVNILVYLSVGIGMITTKFWVIYAVGLMILVDLLTMLHNFTVRVTPDFYVLFSFVVHIILIVWFFSKKEKFSK